MGTRDDSSIVEGLNDDDDENEDSESESLIPECKERGMVLRISNNRINEVSNTSQEELAHRNRHGRGSHPRNQDYSKAVHFHS